jgi:hypothetical protein
MNNTYALHVEENTIFSDNINNTVRLYGNDVLVKIVNKKIFEGSDNEIYIALVQYDDSDIILGKLIHPKYFTSSIYRAIITVEHTHFKINITYPILKYYIDPNNYNLFKYNKMLPLSNKNKKRKCLICKNITNVKRVVTWCSVDYFCQSCFDDQQLSDNDQFMYENKCAIIKKIIEQKYSDVNFIYDVNDDSGLIEIIINNQSKMTILRDNTVSEILRHIKTKLDITWKEQDCGVCFEKINKRVSCPKCSNYYCSNCYINIFKTGKGIIACPFCRYSYGTMMTDLILSLAVEEIKYKLGE